MEFTKSGISFQERMVVWFLKRDIVGIVLGCLVLVFWLTKFRVVCDCFPETLVRRSTLPTTSP